MPSGLDAFNERVCACARCPRLAEYVASFRQRDGYWARPVPGFGDPAATLLVLGLAPGAHGANRTGRPFTGDGAGGFLYRALHEHGYATAPESVSMQDGLELSGAYISNAVRCVPPLNKPNGAEIRTCASWLAEELALLSRVRVTVALGKIAHDAYVRFAKERGAAARMADHRFGHGAVHQLPGLPTLVDSYHSSRYNVNVGKLTWPMFRDIFAVASRLSRERSLRRNA
jgi:uracil-DNA glycosylase family 4